MNTVEPLEYGADLLAGQHDGQEPGPLGPNDIVEPRQIDAEHLAIEEQQGAQGLVLGGGCHFVVNGERCQERGDVGRSHLSRVALVVEEDVSLDPVDVGLLRAAAVVSGADSIPHAVEKSALWRRGRTGFMDGEHGTGGALRRGGIRDVAAGRKANHAHAFEIPFCS